MRDIPLLILAIAVSAYWLGVGRMVIRVRHQTRHDVGVVPQQRQERIMWLVWVPLVVAWIALPWIALQRSDAPWGMPDAGGPLYGALRFVAALVAIGCFAATARCWARMGKHWRMDIALDAKTELITDGPFRMIRHPIYAYQALLVVCSAVILPTVPMLLVAVVHIGLVNMKARNEERHLLSSHGDAYARYIERTGRFFPRFGAHDS